MIKFNPLTPGVYKMVIHTLKIFSVFGARFLTCVWLLGGLKTIGLKMKTFS